MSTSQTEEPKLAEQQAGIAAYRRAVDGTVEILLVTALSHPTSWIFPMGSVKAGESLREAAARECVEESGYRVEPGSFVTTLDLHKDDGIHRVSFFAGTVVGEAQERETERDRRWVQQRRLVDAVPEVFKPVAEAVAAMRLEPGS